MSDSSRDLKDQTERVKSYVHSVKKQFECSICLDFFDNPVVTNCQHTFCKKCIENFIGNKRSQSCPLCKKNVNLRSLSNFAAMENWVQKAKHLVSSFDTDLGIEYKPSHNSMLYEKEIRRSTDEDNLSLTKQKRKRSRSYEKKATKKKKSLETLSSTDTPTTSSSKKKQPRKTKAANKDIVQIVTAQENNHDIGKVQEWLNNKENPFEAKKVIHFQEINNASSTASENQRRIETNSVLTIGASSDTASSSVQIDSLRNELELNGNEPVVPKKSIKNNNLINNSNNANTNTTHKKFNSAHTQTDPYLSNETHINVENEFNLIEKNLIEILLNEFETDCTDEIIRGTVNNNLVQSAKEQSSLQVICDTPPMQNNLNNLVNDTSANKTADIVTVIPDTCVITDTNVNIVITDTCQINYEEPPRAAPQIRNPIPNPHQFSELMGNPRPLNSGEKKSKKLLFKRDRLPTLDFLDQSSEDQPRTPKGKLSALDPKKKFLFDSKLVINDTPQKGDDEHLKNFKELNETLSKSANRVEFADSRFLENSSLRYDGSFEITNNRTNFNETNNQSRNPETTMPYEHNDIDETNLDEPCDKTDTAITSVTNTNISNIEKNSKELVSSSVKKENEVRQISKKMVKEKEQEVIMDETSLQGPLLPHKIEKKVPDNNNDQETVKFSKPINKITEEPTQPITNHSKPIRHTPKHPPPPPPPIDNSYNFDSMDMTTNPTGMLPPNMSMIQTFVDPNQSSRRSQVNNVPPAAADILGTSYMSAGGDSMQPTNSTVLGDITNKRKSQNFVQNDLVSIKSSEQTSEKSLNNDENIFKVPSIEKFVSKEPDSAETALLTDSELFVIDNLCKDMYSVHNQTIDGSTSGNNLDMTTVSSLLPKKHDRVEFVCSLLKPDKKDMVKRFARFIKATVADDVTDTTTHLVVESDKDFVCGVTSKYLKAISRKIWIVSIIWILSSVNQNKLLDPADFEIKGDGIFGLHNGPRSSRLSTTDLFDSYEFLFIGKFESDSINLKEMIKLATKNGANVVRKAKDFSDNTIRTVLFDESKRISAQNANFMLESAKIFSVTTSWLLDSLACYSIRDMKLYALYSDD